jgi:hypothetical protein
LIDSSEILVKLYLVCLFFKNLKPWNGDSIFSKTSPYKNILTTKRNKKELMGHSTKAYGLHKKKIRLWMP